MKVWITGKNYTRPLGILDDDAIERGLKLGVNLKSGTWNKKDGRIRIFSRTFPGTSRSGYCLRSRVIWWIYTGEALSGMEFNIHHKNGDRTDDRIENLEKLTHVEHAHEHNGYRWENVPMSCHVCKECGSEFKIAASRLKDKTSGKRGSFCSQECYKAHPKKLKTHCPKGHEFVEGSYYPITDKYGHKSKSCKICRKGKV